MNTLNFFVIIIFTGILSLPVFAQSTFLSLSYPKSIKAAGLGDQGVASPSSFDAMQHNPAGLAFSDSISFSYFRNPNNNIGYDFPLTSYNASVRLGKNGCIGIDYTNLDYGEFTVSTPDKPNGTGEKYNYYQRSLAIGYAYRFSKTLSVGLQMRYAWEPGYQQEYLDGPMFSAGLLYQPEIFNDRLTLGFSLMNFGNVIERTTIDKSQPGAWQSHNESYPTPAKLNLGIEACAVKNDFFNLIVSLGAVKSFGQKTQSTFKSLFDEWNDFPNDMAANAGIGYVWHPVSLGKGISFIQELYLGYTNIGPQTFAHNYFTHGINIGLDIRGIKATAGIAGRWSDSYKVIYLTPKFPNEIFQFSLSSNFSFLSKSKIVETERNTPSKIILSAGYAHGVAVGKMKESILQGSQFSYSDNSNWMTEADFYISNNSAIVSSFGFSSIKLNIKALPPYSGKLDIDEETLSFESGYRYHPLDVFTPVFIQASLGVIRINPINMSTSPDYYYKAFSRLSVGALFPISNTGIVIIPKAGLRTIFMEAWPNFNGLNGFNQFEFGVNVGYSI